MAKDTAIEQTRTCWVPEITKENLEAKCHAELSTGRWAIDVEATKKTAVPKPRVKDGTTVPGFTVHIVMNRVDPGKPLAEKAKAAKPKVVEIAEGQKSGG